MIIILMMLVYLDSVKKMKRPEYDKIDAEQPIKIFIA